MTLLTNLISYWKLDEASGNALDAHGGNTLTANGAPGAGTGIISGDRTFSGSGQYFNIADNASLSLTGTALTITAWTKSSNAGTQGLIMKSGVGGVTNGDWGIRVAASAGPALILNNSNASGNAGTNYSDNTWHFFVGRYTGSLAQMYVDDVQKASTAFSSALNDGNYDLILGGYFDPSFLWVGDIDEVGLWDRSLSDAELTSLYNAGAGLAYPFGVSSGAPGAAQYYHLLG